MTMRLSEKGKFLQLPIVGLAIKKLIFDGFLTLVFNDQEESFLEFHSSFKVTQHNQTNEIDPKSKDSFVFFYDQFGLTIKEAKADRKGNLWMVFENKTEITVEDGPYENWHYTKKSINHKRDNLYVHGGIGNTTY